jgi:uncharacterized membrane protein HdeD (DUF308 family)
MTPQGRDAGPTPGVGPLFPVLRYIHEDLRELRDNWLWFAILGAVLVVLGAVLLTYSGAVWGTLATAVVLGFLLLLGGIFHIVGAFFTRSWGGFFLSLLVGILDVAVGILMIGHPVDAAIVYTLLMALFFIVEGLFRIIVAVAGQFRNWGYVAASGAITLLLGILIWQQWPSSGLWVIGTFLGVSLIVNGVNYLIIGLRVRQLPA